MKRTTFALLALTVSMLCACATNNPAPATAATSPTASTPTPVSTAELEKKILELEKRAWELSKNKRIEEYGKLLVPEYRAVFVTGIKNLEENLKIVGEGNIKSYSISEANVSFPIKDTAILTYRLDGTAVFEGKEQKAPLNCSSVWVNVGGQWKAALYTETTAGPAK